MKDKLRRIIIFLFKIFYVFPIDYKKVYLVNFNGTSYGFEAKAFAEYLKEVFPNEYEIIWEITDKSNFKDIDGIKFVKKNSIFAVYFSLVSGLLLFNTTPRSYLPYRKNQYIVETWHGYPFKKVGKYAIRYNKAVYSIPTVYSSHSNFYENEVVRNSFDYDGRVLNCGSPRNDIFFKDNVDDLKHRILQKLDLVGKRVAIYAPTFRGDFNVAEQDLDFSKIRGALEKKFGGEWVVIFRYHPMVIAKLKSSYTANDKYDVSFYQDMQELLLVSDLLISDYSGSIWDFSLQKRPVFLFTPDLEQYSNDRGLYFPHENLPYPLAKSEEEMILNIENFDNNEYLAKLNDYFRSMGCHESGKACETILDDYKKFIRTKSGVHT